VRRGVRRRGAETVKKRVDASRGQAYDATYSP
jgi:hypothetical protein